MLHIPLFSPKFLADAAKAHTQELNELQERALPIIREWQESLRSGALAATKEEQLQTDFLEAFFAKILGYESSRGAAVWNLEKEQKNVTDSQKADGALGFFTMQEKMLVSDVRAVIELKGAKSDLDKPQNRKEDKRTPVEQAFAYGSKSGGKCRWVIVSNVVEIRLYHVTDQSRFERFELKTLHESAQLQRFLFLLHRARLLNSTNPNEKSELDALHEQRKEQERTISNEFYGKYKAARVRLFEHLKECNPAHDELLLLQKAQKLLDRLLFVFFCEDLNLLPRQTAYKVIQNAKQSFSAQEGEIWRQLKGLFTAIDKGNPPNNISKFNGGLFAPDAEMDTLSVADSEIESLLHFSEYDFDSDLNVRILGHIFEQSVSDIEELKATITATKHDAKTGKRKRDGIFYTPEYITRFIVQNTVGAYLEERKQECGFAGLPELTDEDFASISISKGILKANKRIEQHIKAWTDYREHVRTVRVCDPACGSGAFLIEIFDFLYAEGQRVNAELSRLRGGQTEVFDLEKHILTQNIFGVDVNAEAVEITKLALWLKTANKGKELTDLDGNIKCGNSLVDDPNVAGTAAFDWKEAFPQVFSPHPSSGHPLPVGEGRGEGGFDVIVGNPPYGADWSKSKAHLERHYRVYSASTDSYTFFFERGMELLQHGGKLGFISSNKFMRSNYGAKLREYLQPFQLDTIVDFGELPVFEDAATFPAIYVLSKIPPHKQPSFTAVKSLDFTDVAEVVTQNGIFLPETAFGNEGWTLANSTKSALLEKMKAAGIPLGNYVGGAIKYGIKTGFNQAFIIDRHKRDELIAEDPKSAEIIKPVVVGDNVRRYLLDFKDQYIILTKIGVEIEQYPAIFKHLSQYQPQLEKRYDKGKHWWELRACDYYTEFEQPKIIFPDIAKESRMYYDEQGLYFGNTAYMMPNADKYLLAVLNSKAVFWFFKNIASVLGDTDSGGRLRWFTQDVVKIPIPQRTAVSITLEAHVDMMLSTNTALADLRKRVLTLLLSKTGITKASTKLQEWDALTWAELEGEFKKAKVKLSLNDQEELLTYFEQKKAEAERLKATLATTDRAIDALVYGLYGLTAEEIAVVEGKA